MGDGARDRLEGRVRNRAKGGAKGAKGKIGDSTEILETMTRMGSGKSQTNGGGPNKEASGKQHGDRHSGSGTHVGGWRLCKNHRTHGTNTYNCAKTETCPMATKLVPKPEQTHETKEPKPVAASGGQVTPVLADTLYGAVSARQRDGKIPPGSQGQDHTAAAEYYTTHRNNHT